MFLVLGISNKPVAIWVVDFLLTMWIFQIMGNVNREGLKLLEAYLWMENSGIWVIACK